MKWCKRGLFEWVVDIKLGRLMPTFGIQWGGSDFLMLDFIADLKKQYPNHIVLVRGYGPGKYFYYGYDSDADVINKVLKYKIVDFGSFYRAGGPNLGKMKGTLLTKGYSVVVYVKDHVASVTTPASFMAEKAKIAVAKKAERAAYVPISYAYSPGKFSARKESQGGKWENGVWVPGLPSSRMN